MEKLEIESSARKVRTERQNNTRFGTLAFIALAGKAAQYDDSLICH